MSDMVFDLDDLCDDFNPWSELHALKERFPGLKVTLFAIPGRCSDELLARYRDLDWVELGVHGYHHSTMECAAWTYDETVEKLREIAEFWSGSKLFKAPGWIANQAVYDALFDEGWMVADNAFHCENFGEQPIKRYVYNIPFDGISIHGHTWDCMGNGPSDWDALFDGVPSNATFRFVSEVCEPLSWVDKINKSYLPKVIGAMGLKKGDLFVDVGSHEGHEIDILESMGVRVLAFEPHPKYAKVLSEKWSGSGLVEFVDAAAGKANGSSVLYENDHFESGSSLFKEKSGANDVHYPVKVVRLADTLRGRDVKVLKLDVEGSEWEILDDLLESGVLEKIEHIYLEDHINRINSGEMRDLRKSVIERCASRGISLREWV